MYAIKPIMTAGLAAALGLAPAAFAQSAAPTAAPSAQTAAPSAPATSAQTPSTTTTQQPSSTADPQASANQEASRQALAAARQSLAELTKLPEAQKLEGEQRTAVANFISDFNAFATAQTDWRSKYQVVDESLNKLLGAAEGGAAAASSTASTGTAPSTTGSAGASGTAAGLDPAIVAKLQEVRTHLKEFEQNSGDPLFAVDAIQKQLDQASASGGGANGVTLSAAQVDNIRKQLETIRQAAKK
jgi:hypothetical protein